MLKLKLLNLNYKILIFLFINFLPINNLYFIVTISSKNNWFQEGVQSVLFFLENRLQKIQNFYFAGIFIKKLI